MCRPPPPVRAWGCEVIRHLIIGNGPAGVVAAETLRRADPQAEITLIGDEAEPPYSRMAIPYLLSGKIGEPGTYLRKEAAHFEGLRIGLLCARVAGLDSTRRTATLADGSVLAWDRVLIASGAHPVQPPIPGIDLPQVLSCLTLADARRIAAAVAPGSRVLQMGAGFIGCIILESLAARGPQLTVVEMGERMVPRMLDEVAGGMIRRWCEEKGVQVRTGRRVQAIDALGKTLLVRLDDWLGPVVAGKTRLDAISTEALGDALRGQLEWAQRQQVDQLAPPRIDVPSGMQRAITYALDAEPVLAVKLQELFGLADTPTIARGRVPLTLHLLSPAGRPLQVTRDLKGFWERTYPEVKREMKGRYPKHPWPDDPWTAAPTHRAKPRGR